ncbi:DUF397 domain-containing protein [Nocardia nepalensis]|uniref:DUF397 domain-containing protein n=1 Tax=Nocardia nepalensis TaxID=3375448 RepID=UPI003B6789EE
MITGDRLECRISSYSSNGENCVEIAPTTGWRKSGRSGGTDAVANAPSASAVYMRHSKHRDAEAIEFDLAVWTRFSQEPRPAVRSDNGAVQAIMDSMDNPSSDVELRFDDGNGPPSTQMLPTVSSISPVPQSNWHNRTVRPTSESSGARDVPYLPSDWMPASYVSPRK